MATRKAQADELNVYREQMLLQHNNHGIYKGNLNKIALNRHLDKRKTQGYQISTLARTHYVVKKNQVPIKDKRLKDAFKTFF